MNKAQFAAVCVITLGGFGLTAVVLGRGSAEHSEHHGHGEVAAPAAEKGPHGGRMLRDADGFALEVTIYEPDIPPQSRVYAYRDDRPIDPASVQLALELHRFDSVDVFSYKAQDGYLQGDKIVEEPHSFDVRIKATANGKSYAWEYSSYEGRTELGVESAASAGLVFEQAAPRKLAVRLPVLGQVRVNEDSARHVSPRFAGVVRELRKQVGDLVRAGDTLAVVEGNDSLQAFEVRAAGGGRVIEKRVTPGETVASGATLYIVADLSTVWVDFTIYKEDVGRVRAGQPVTLRTGADAAPLTGALSYIAPIGHVGSQSTTARSVVRNPEGKLRPGLFVEGELLVEEVSAPVAVKQSALQTFRAWDVVFKQRGKVYEIAIVELGVRDGDWVEVRSGLTPGQTYVAENSFVVKAEIGKAGATHDH